MFTGIVEATGEISEIAPAPAGLRLRLTTGLAPQLAPGDSLAVNGVCLTIVSADAAGVSMDVSPETMRVTSLGSLAGGGTVNLERPMRADGRLGGHFVQGHVDATATVERIRQDGESWWMSFGFPPALAPTIVRKGSIAVDGISLTVADVADARFDVQVIPFTWTHTNLHARAVGDVVNVECDILGKYVLRVLESMAPPARP